MADACGDGGGGDGGATGVSAPMRSSVRAMSQFMEEMRDSVLSVDEKMEKTDKAVALVAECLKEQSKKMQKVEERMMAVEMRIEACAEQRRERRKEGRKDTSGVRRQRAVRRAQRTEAGVQVLIKPRTPLKAISKVTLKNRRSEQVHCAQVLDEPTKLSPSSEVPIQPDSQLLIQQTYQLPAQHSSQLSAQHSSQHPAQPASQISAQYALERPTQPVPQLPAKQVIQPPTQHAPPLPAELTPQHASQQHSSQSTTTGKLSINFLTQDSSQAPFQHYTQPPSHSCSPLTAQHTSQPSTRHSTQPIVQIIKLPSQNVSPSFGQHSSQLTAQHFPQFPVHHSAPSSASLPASPTSSKLMTYPSCTSSTAPSEPSNSMLSQDDAGKTSDGTCTPVAKIPSVAPSLCVSTSLQELHTLIESLSIGSASASSSRCRMFRASSAADSQETPNVDHWSPNTDPNRPLFPREVFPSSSAAAPLSLPSGSTPTPHRPSVPLTSSAATSRLRDVMKILSNMCRSKVAQRDATSSTECQEDAGHSILNNSAEPPWQAEHSQRIETDSTETRRRSFRSAEVQCDIYSLPMCVKDSTRRNAKCSADQSHHSQSYSPEESSSSLTDDTENGSSFADADESTSTTSISDEIPSPPPLSITSNHKTYPQTDSDLKKFTTHTKAKKVSSRDCAAGDKGNLKSSDPMVTSLVALEAEVTTFLSNLSHEPASHFTPTNYLNESERVDSSTWDTSSSSSLSPLSSTHCVVCDTAVSKASVHPCNAQDASPQKATKGEQVKKNFDSISPEPFGSKTQPVAEISISPPVISQESSSSSKDCSLAPCLDGSRAKLKAARRQKTKAPSNCSTSSLSCSTHPTSATVPQSPVSLDPLQVAGEPVQSSTLYSPPSQLSSSTPSRRVLKAVRKAMKVRNVYPSCPASFSIDVNPKSMVSSSSPYTDSTNSVYDTASDFISSDPDIVPILSPPGNKERLNFKSNDKFLACDSTHAQDQAFPSPPVVLSSKVTCSFPSQPHPHPGLDNRLQKISDDRSKDSFSQVSYLYTSCSDEPPFSLLSIRDAAGCQDNQSSENSQPAIETNISKTISKQCDSDRLSYSSQVTSPSCSFRNVWPSTSAVQFHSAVELSSNTRTVNDILEKTQDDENRISQATNKVSLATYPLALTMFRKDHDNVVHHSNSPCHLSSSSTPSPNVPCTPFKLSTCFPSVSLSNRQSSEKLIFQARERGEISHLRNALSSNISTPQEKKPAVRDTDYKTVTYNSVGCSVTPSSFASMCSLIETDTQLNEQHEQKKGDKETSPARMSVSSYEARIHNEPCSSVTIRFRSTCTSNQTSTAKGEAIENQKDCLEIDEDEPTRLQEGSCSDFPTSSFSSEAGPWTAPHVCGSLALPLTVTPPNTPATNSACIETLTTDTSPQLKVQETKSTASISTSPSHSSTSTSITSLSVPIEQSPPSRSPPQTNPTPSVVRRTSGRSKGTSPGRKPISRLDASVVRRLYSIRRKKADAAAGSRSTSSSSARSSGRQPAASRKVCVATNTRSRYRPPFNTNFINETRRTKPKHPRKVTNCSPPPRLPAAPALPAAVDGGGGGGVVAGTCAASTQTPVADLLGIRLLQAAHEGRRGEAARLVRAGADVNYRNPCRWTPLHRAARGGHAHLAALLVRLGADVDAATSHGYTPLHMAAYNDRSGVCAAVLARAGALVDVWNKFGQTPLHCAAEAGNETALRVLVAFGASKCVKNMDGKTPRDVAANDAVKYILRARARRRRRRHQRRRPHGSRAKARRQW